MPTLLPAKAKAKRTSPLLPGLIVWLTDGLRLGTICLLLLLGKEIISHPLPALPTNDCLAYAQLHPDLAKSALDACVAFQHMGMP